jgi:hypothetical protein
MFKINNNQNKFNFFKYFKMINNLIKYLNILVFNVVCGLIIKNLLLN